MHDTHQPNESHSAPIATWPIDGTLDLHAFKPGEVGGLESRVAGGAHGGCAYDTHAKNDMLDWSIERK
jgi:hypothetical protein